MHAPYCFICLIACGAVCATAVADDSRPPIDASLPWFSPRTSNWALFADTRIQEQYDAIPIRRFDSDWSQGFAPHAGRNLLFQRNRAAAGVEKDGWRIGVEIRQEALLVTDRQTLAFIAMVKQHIKPEDAASYKLQAQMESWKASGIQVGRLFKLPAPAGMHSSLDVSVALYGKPVYRDNAVAGTVGYTPPETFGADLIQRDANTRASFPFQTAGTSGRGASASVALDIAVTEAVNAKLRVDDLFSRLRFSALPVTTQRANTTSARFDSQNFVSFQPVLSGMNVQQDSSNTIRRYASAALEYADGAWGANLQLDRYAGVSMPLVGLSHKFSWGKITGSYMVRYNAAALSYEQGRFRISAQTDALHTSNANVIGLQASYRHLF